MKKLYKNLLVIFMTSIVVGSVLTGSLLSTIKSKDSNEEKSSGQK
jgi:hypothetical protein